MGTGHMVHVNYMGTAVHGNRAYGAWKLHGNCSTWEQGIKETF